MKKYAYKIFMFVLMTITILSCHNNKQVSLRLQWFHLAQFSGFYCAEDQGFYKKEQINIKINPGGPDFNAITLVASGDETFGVWTADQILMAQSKGVPITIIAAIYRDDPNVLMVKENSPIKSPEDFKGKRITTVFGRSTETVLNALLSNFSIDKKDVTIEPFPYSLQSFLEGKVDVSAGYVYDHPYQALKEGVTTRLIKPSDYGIKFYSDCIFTRNDLIASNPDLVQRFINASIKGWEYALANKDSAVVSTIRRSPQLDESSQLYLLNAAEPLIRAENEKMLGLIDDSSISRMADILKEQNQLPKDFNARNSFNNQFINGYYNSKKK